MIPIFAGYALFFVVLTLPSANLVARIPLWLTVCIMSRDVVIVLTVAIVNLAVERTTFPPTLLGKAATAIYILTCLVFLTVNYLGKPSPLTGAIVYLALAVTVVSALHYIGHAARIINHTTQ